MLGQDANTVEALRKLITMLPRIPWVPRVFAQMRTEDARWIETTAKLRQAVERELERMVPECVLVAEMPEVDEGELNPSKQTFENAQP